MQEKGRWPERPAVKLLVPEGLMRKRVLAMRLVLQDCAESTRGVACNGMGWARHVSGHSRDGSARDMSYAQIRRAALLAICPSRWDAGSPFRKHMYQHRRVVRLPACPCKPVDKEHRRYKTLQPRMRVRGDAGRMYHDIARSYIRCYGHAEGMRERARQSNGCVMFIASPVDRDSASAAV
ncbi:hypothetical protein BD626DRAFT_541390 [Schizophyllum amplum]|uniref:Uncharacterized protein n=1 Tax=Schizophyllum amplum TaxID=97359 RepID=A0A550BUY1_9AGAR|nr:hypothetical protein BD626DRAFT_541390 [Auriculariopsis ampla]